MTDASLLKRYAAHLAGVTLPFSLAAASAHFRVKSTPFELVHPHALPFTPEMRAIYEANRQRLAGKSSPAECSDIVERIISNA